MPNEEISLSTKLVSIEVVTSTLIALFLISGSWFNLSYASDSNKSAIEDLKSAQELTSKDLSQIKTDVAVLLDRQIIQSKNNDRRLASINKSIKDVRNIMHKIHLNESNR